MLKFIRKYQLIVLAVGGSLLMVVFLLQPVLQQLTPDPRKQVVATIGGPKGTRITMGEQVRANIELDMLERFLPEIFTLLGIEPEHKTAHWILLKHEAERVGVMGVQQDGTDWIPELAFGIVLVQAQLMRQMGQTVTAEQMNDALVMTTENLQLRRSTLIRGTPGLSEQVFSEILSKARGVARLRRLYSSAPRLSEPQALRALERLGVRVLTDQVVLGPELVLDEIPEPTDGELAAHLDRFRNNRPGDTEGSEFGFGYLLPARVKMEWLTLDPMRIAEVVEADPVLVRRRWQTDHASTPFEEARSEIARAIREEKVSQILSEADETIRGEMLSLLRGVEREGIYRALPRDWTPPDLERIAQDVVASVSERHGVRIPLPAVVRRTDAWLTPAQIQQLPGVGRAMYRVGNRNIPVASIPSMVRGVGEDRSVAVQPGVPIIDPVAEGAGRTRYYITVLDARGESPPDGVDEIRETLVRDLKNYRAFQRLAERADEFADLARAGGIPAVADLFRSDDGQSRVLVRENILVSRDGLAPATQSFQDSRANVEGFRRAVLELGRELDPTAPADTLPPSESVVVVPLPSTRVVAVARVRAKIPPTLEEFRRFEQGLVAQEATRMIEEGETEGGPLEFARLSARLGFSEVKQSPAAGPRDQTPADAG